MNQKELAEMLNGRQYADEISPDIQHILTGKENDLVVVFGASDDLMEFRGAIYDEVGCYDGGKAYLNKTGLLVNKCACNECPYFERELARAVVVEALWDKEEPFTWTYKTDIPHETFIIHEDDDMYCRGIVFNLSDIINIQKAGG